MTARGTGVRAQVVAILNRRFPCQAVPHGALSEIGVELGVTRERVRQIANESGWGGRLPVVSKKVIVACAQCGERPRRAASEFCRQCAWVVLPCTECGAPVRRLASRLVEQAGAGGDRRRALIGARPGYTAHVFCNHGCQAAYMGHRNSKAFRESVSA